MHRFKGRHLRDFSQFLIQDIVLSESNIGNFKVLLDAEAVLLGHCWD